MSKEPIEEFLKGTGEQIVIGPIEIRKLRDGSYWLEHISGEGTQAPARIVEDAVTRLFKETM